MAVSILSASRQEICRHTRRGSVSNKTIRNQTSARVSVPSLFKPSTNATSEFGFIWRTPLSLTEPYWSGTHVAHHSSSSVDVMITSCRMVYWPIRLLPCRSHCPTPHISRYRSTGQAADDWPDAGKVPTGGGAERGSYATRG